MKVTTLGWMQRAVGSMILYFLNRVSHY